MLGMVTCSLTSPSSEPQITNLPSSLKVAFICILSFTSPLNLLVCDRQKSESMREGGGEQMPMLNKTRKHCMLAMHSVTPQGHDKKIALCTGRGVRIEFSTTGPNPNKRSSSGDKISSTHQIRDSCLTEYPPHATDVRYKLRWDFSRQPKGHSTYKPGNHYGTGTH